MASRNAGPCEKALALIGKRMDEIQDEFEALNKKIDKLASRIDSAGAATAVTSDLPCEVLKVHDAAYDEIDRKTPKLLIEWLYERGMVKPSKREDRCEWKRLDECEDCVERVEDFMRTFSKSKAQPGISAFALYNAWSEAKKGFASTYERSPKRLKESADMTVGDVADVGERSSYKAPNTQNSDILM